MQNSKDNHLFQAMIKEDRYSELFVSLCQALFVMVVGALYLLSPPPSDSTVGLGPVPVILLSFIPAITMRLRLWQKDKLSEWKTYFFIAFDFFLLTALIYSFHHQYKMPLASSLKAPTFIYYFLFVAMQSFRLRIRYMLSAGVFAFLHWSVLTYLAITRGDVPITNSYIDYITGTNILIGAEVEKIFVLMIFTVLISGSVFRLRSLYLRSMRELLGAQELLEIQNAEKLKFAEKKRQLAEKNQSIERSKLQFLQTITHELRTPLNGVMASLDVFANYPMNPEQEESLKITQYSTQKIGRFIDDIIVAAQLSEFTVNPKKVDLYDELRSYLEIFKKVVCKDSECKFEYKFEGVAEKEYYSVDIRRITDIFDHVLDFCFRETSLREILIHIHVVELENADWLLRLAVTGDGLKFDPDLVEQINSRHYFEQLDFGAYNKDSDLILAGQLAEKLGGEFSLIELSEKGSGFECLIPLGSKIEAAKLAADRTQKILVVDDEMINCRVLEKILKNLGKEVSIAKNGAIAVEKATHDCYDVIFMDIRMPVLDGIQAMGQIKDFQKQNQACHTPIIAITAHAHGNYREECLEMGFDGFAEKPVNKKTIENLLAEVQLLESA